jgi:peptide-methionine (S)-S-oxide reductase
MQIATLGAGCFWGIQSSFDKIKGVTKTTVGYMGGKIENPTYEDVCTGKTGFIEVVQIEFDSQKIKYTEILDIFWNIHNPSQENGQGFDIGSQYKSVIFYHSNEQKKIAEESKKRLEKSNKYNKKIITEIREKMIFYPAEEYHQKYFEKMNCNR